MNQWHTFPALLTSCIFPALPGFQLTICLWSVLPQQASAPNLAFAVCSQGSLSFHLPYFLLNLCFLLGDFSWFSCCNNHFINLISICEHEEIGKAENSDSQLIVPESPGSEEGIIKDWMLPSMTLISNCIETHRETLHFFPRKKSVLSTENSIWLDNHQKTPAEEPHWNPALVTHKDLFFEHIFWYKKKIPPHWADFYKTVRVTFSVFLAYFDDLLIYSTGFLKHLRHADMAPNYFMETGLKLKVSNWCFIL